MKYKYKELTVYKRDDMIQRARYDLTLREQRIVLYALSQIKADDDYDTLYSIELKDLYNICNVDDESYSRFKSIIHKLADKSWEVLLPSGYISIVRWFSVVRISRDTGLIQFKFHEDMAPYVFDLVRQNKFYTGYQIVNVLPMTKQASPRLYELFKSYSKNNDGWRFDIQHLKSLLCAEHYSEWADFRRRVLEPSIEEINRLTDLNVSYKVEKDGRKVSAIVFVFEKCEFPE
jgi:plasmid replication initiation protein